MTTAIGWILGILSAIASTIASAAIIYVFKLIIRVEVLERLYNEKKITLEALRANQAELDKRVTRLEDAVLALRDLVPELKKLGTMAQKLELLFEVKDKRLDDLEDKVYHGQ